MLCGRYGGEGGGEYGDSVCALGGMTIHIQKAIKQLKPLAQASSSS